MKTIKIKYHSDILRMKKIEIGNWIDLRSAEDVRLSEGENKLISLGVAMKLPDGYEAHVVPRSSTLKNFGIIQGNSFGVIDNSYCGNNDIWFFNAIAMRDTAINRNDRICQFRIQKIQPDLNFVEVDDLGESDRSGYGSTGIK